MTPGEQAEAFAHELNKLVSRFCDEFDMLAATALGVMQLKMHTIIKDMIENLEDEE